MKNTVVKQVAGIDIGKNDFFVCYKALNNNGDVKISGTKKFKNNNNGINDYYCWIKKHNKTIEAPLFHVMEATGIYYENLAYFLFEKGDKVSVQLAQKVKYFAKSTNVKTKNDKSDSKVIADFGIEKNLNNSLWEPPSQKFKMIRDLTREHTSLKNNVTAAKSQLHAYEHAHNIDSNVLLFKKRQIDFYNSQITELEGIIESLVESDKEFHSKVEKIITIKGVRLMTVLKVLSETNGFILFKNIRQLISYAGLDVIENESGTYKGRTKISKKGNSKLRTALYLPAMSAARYNTNLKKFYDRINDGKEVKKQGIIAVMRKLLILIYTLWKKEEEYIENYNVA